MQQNEYNYYKKLEENWKNNSLKFSKTLCLHYFYIMQFTSVGREKWNFATYVCNTCDL